MRVAYLPNRTVLFENDYEANKIIIQQLASEYDDPKATIEWLECKYPHLSTYRQMWMTQALFDLGASRICEA